MKRISKDILRGWADRRRKNMVYEELMNGELTYKKKPLRKPTTVEKYGDELQSSAAESMEEEKKS